MSQPIYFEGASPMVPRSKKLRLDEMAGEAPEGRGPLTTRKYEFLE